MSAEIPKYAAAFTCNVAYERVHGARQTTGATRNPHAHLNADRMATACVRVRRTIAGVESF